MLQAVLNHQLPSEWQAADYSDRTYQLFSVADDSDEYASVTAPFTETLTVHSLRRCQNPFQLGRLVVRLEQLQYRGEVMARVTYYHPLDAYDLDRALEYNMDVRRYHSRCDRHHRDRKYPVFFSSLEEAYSVVSGCAGKVILVCHVLEKNGRSSSTTYKNVDTEYMPNYVAVVDSST